MSIIQIPPKISLIMANFKYFCLIFAKYSLAINIFII